MNDNQLRVDCCIAGGGPAGMILGLLLARAGVNVLVLEKHADFLRDFRGDTIHPSTLEIMHELGLLDEFLKLPHQEAPTLTGQIGDVEIPVADFTHLKTQCKFLVLMPQWDFLNFIAREARRYANFQLRMQAAVTELIEESGRIAGVRATTQDGPLEVRASLVIGADGRRSTVREKAGLIVDELGAPMDVLWFSLPRHGSDRDETVGRFDAGRIFVMINRGEHWQCGYVISKGSNDDIRAKGLKAFQDDIVRLAPFLRDRAGELDDWDRVKLLTVSVDRLREWYRPGLLCIGDAAHAMSPVGGVGINLAVQDAVATANLLAVPLRDGTCTTADLGRVQRRRALPTRWTQAGQLFVQRRIITRVLDGGGTFSPPWPLRLLARFPILRRIPARLIGVGVRAEHVQSPAAH